MARVLFLGRLRDVAGVREMELAVKVESLADLRDMIARENPALGQALREPGVRVAINRVFAETDGPLAEADEIAFMPPLSGG
mgnify:CR=1 FL=1